MSQNNITEQDRLFLKLVHNTPIKRLEEIFRACGVQEEQIQEFKRIAEQ